MVRTTWILILTLLVISPTLLCGQDAKLTVASDKPGVTVSPYLYGIFFEEINRAGEGGIYSEMVMNRSLENGTDRENKCFALVTNGAEAKGKFSRSSDSPLNAANKYNLKLEVESGDFVGVSNSGFDGGMVVKAGETYNLSLFASAAEPFAGKISARLQTADGKILAQSELGEPKSEWSRFEAKLTAKEDSKAARLVVGTNARGVIYFDVISLQPAKTWKNRTNGLRPDLMEMIANMHPAFVRFPGGCYVEGERVAEAFRWKKSIGPIETRPGHWNLWGYHSTDGLGYHEYLQMCEDLGAAPMYVINCGMAHRDSIAMNEMNEFVQDALDAIEYANGPVDSKWGAMRAANGHPAPFNLKFMEIGNENGGRLYDERYALFYDAIHAKYPDIRLVACHWGGRPPNSRPLDLVDEHYYNTPNFFINRFDMYDKYDRNGYKVYVGEYAVTQGCGRGNLIAALGEAVYMCGLERNGDIVHLASYAPLLVNPKWQRWNPNAIVFDAGRAYGTPSYHVQGLFARNRADVILPMEITAPSVAPTESAGSIGLGTWASQAEFKDFKFESARADYNFSSDFSTNLDGWRAVRGQWSVKDGLLVQSGNDREARIVVSKRQFGNGTLSVKARKTGGEEGFLILFQNQDGEKNWWNIGGWGNNEHGLELEGLDEAHVPGSIETGKWYDIKIQLEGSTVTCYLDGKLIQKATHKPRRAIYGVAGRDLKTNDLVLKVVNVGPTPLDMAIDLPGNVKLKPNATGWVMTSGNRDDENTFNAPTKVIPQEFKLANVARGMKHTFPANSITVLRLGEQN